MTSHGLEYIDRPPFSLDFNLMEYIWRIIKVKLHLWHPHTMHLKDNEADRAELARYVGSLGLGVDLEAN